MPTRRHTASWTNWSGTLQSEVPHRANPVTLEQVQAEVLRAAEEGERLRPVGSGHSFSPLCWTDENHLSLERFTGIESTDLQRQRVWVRGGTPLRSLADSLAARGLALENAPDNDRITISGAISTASHGSGGAFGSLATQVTGLRMVCADGTVREFNVDTDAEALRAVVVSLGALGVVTHVELQCVDDYRLETTAMAMTLGEAIERLPLMRTDYRNASLFWFPYGDSAVLRTLDVTRARATRLAPLRQSAVRAVEQHAFRALAAATRKAPEMATFFSRTVTRRVTRRTGVVSAADAYALRRSSRYQILEYALPLDQAAPALQALSKIIPALSFSVTHPVELRFVKGDRIWLSPFYERDSACIAVPAYPDKDSERYFATISELLERHGGRPHWGMVHPHTADHLRTMYPRFDEFLTLRRQYDPHGVFLNPHLAALFGESLR